MDERLLYNRAFEAVLWAMPFLNTLEMREALAEVGVKDGKLAFIGSPPTAKLILPTFNNQTAYIFGSLSLDNGPVVVEVPAETKKAKLFGSIFNVWDDPLEDIGPAGTDAGKGGKYLLIPPGFQGSVPDGVFKVQSNTFDVHFWLRSVAAAAGKRAWTDAAAYARTLKLYNLGNKPKPIDLVDVTKLNGVLEGNAMAHHDIFRLIDVYIQTEPAQRENLAMRGLLKSIGIEKGKVFEPNSERQKIFDAAIKDAFAYMESYLGSGKAFVPFWTDRGWGAFRITPEIIKSGGTWNFETYRDYSARSLDFAYWAVGMPKAFDSSGGGATFYLMTSTDAERRPFDGGKSYKLTVPANPPAKDFWSVLLYSTKTRSFTDSVRFGLSSKDGIKKNKDGTVDLYLAPKAPKGKEKNWLATKPGDGLFLVFRFYGPTKELTSKKWKLNDPELLK